MPLYICSILPRSPHCQEVDFSITLQSDKRKSHSSQNKTSATDRRHSQLDLKHKLTIIKSVILPILTCASVAWGFTAKTYRRLLQRKKKSIAPTSRRCTMVRKKRLKTHPVEPDDQGRQGKSSSNWKATQTLT